MTTTPAPSKSIKKRLVTLRINGQEYEGLCEPRMTLADFIREVCGLTGTHLGCEHGVCGACTVLLDGDAVRSCLMLAVQAEGHDLRTVEGMAEGDKLHPLQQAFWEYHALQCGFCTPGMLLAAEDFLKEHPNPTEQEVREGMSGNLCRCTGYVNIIKAIRAAAARMRGEEPPDPVPSIAPGEVPKAAAH